MNPVRPNLILFFFDLVGGRVIDRNNQNVDHRDKNHTDPDGFPPQQEHSPKSWYKKNHNALLALPSKLLHAWNWNIMRTVHTRACSTK